MDAEKEDVSLMVRLDRATRSDMDKIQGLKIAGAQSDGPCFLRELVHPEKAVEDKSIYHKNLMPVTYVTADVAGVIESPVYAMLKLGPEIDKIKIPEGYADRAAHGRPSLRPGPLLDEVGRRMAHHI